MTDHHELLDPNEPGIELVPGFVGSTTLAAIESELADSNRVTWHDNHDTYVNQRGLTIVQNHNTFALKLSRGDQTPLQRLPYIRNTIGSIQQYIRDMAVGIRTLRGWQPDEVSIHTYDDAEVGLSLHKDNKRFVGLIAILSVTGVCDQVINHAGRLYTYTAEPGTLTMLRAPGLVASTRDIRPEHAVLRLQTPTRTSLMVRANDRPDEQIPGFTFANW